MSNKIAISLSLLANVVLVASLAVTARSVNKKVEATTQADAQQCLVAVKSLVKVGYMGGCMTAIADAKHVEEGDPLIPLYMDYCMQGAQAISDQVDFKK